MTRRALLLAAFRASGLRLGGTFLQLNSGHREWLPERWSELFGYFRRLGLQRLIVQWTADEDVSFVDLLPRLFDEAAKSPMRVTLGLRNERAFWNRNAANRSYTFAGLYERSLPLIESLTPFALRPEFDGWYIPQEFDDVNWSRKEARRAGGDYLRSLVRQLRKARPGSRVSVSSFANGGMAPKDFARLWHDVLRHARIDELLFQDGVGAKKLQIEKASEYLGALHMRLGAKVGAIVEVFEQVRDDPFEAVPASSERIRRQLAVVSEHGLGEPVIFSVPEYATPLGGQAAAQLFEELQATNAR